MDESVQEKVERLRLLIIEDDEDQRELIRETLEGRVGAGTVSGADSRAAALKHDLAAFDMILSDYNLPDATGMQLLEEIKSRCETPVIMVTGENVGRIATEAIGRGATDYIVKIGDYLFTIPLVVEKNLAVARIKKENQQLQAQLKQALHEVQEKNQQLEKSLKRVEEVAATDPLTGLYNRRHFGKVVEQLFNEAQRYDTDLSCVMIDLDGYKQLNDSYGHQIGDQLLVVAGKVISANMRKMDVAARYGGDEFVLLLPRAGSQEAGGVVTRIRDEYRQGSAIVLRRNEGVTMSIGIGSMKSDLPAGSEQLIAVADGALYQAKGEGRNRIVVSGATGAKNVPTR